MTTHCLEQLLIEAQPDAVCTFIRGCGAIDVVWASLLHGEIKHHIEPTNNNKKEKEKCHTEDDRTMVLDSCAAAVGEMLFCQPIVHLHCRGELFPPYLAPLYMYFPPPPKGSDADGPKTIDAALYTSGAPYQP